MIFRRLCVDVDFDGLVLGLSAEWWDPLTEKRVALVVPVWDPSGLDPHAALELLLSGARGMPGARPVFLASPRRSLSVAQPLEGQGELPLLPLPPALGGSPAVDAE